jgi:O-antigen ligase
MSELKKDYFKAYLFLYVFLLPWDLWKPQMGVLSTILFIWWLYLGKKRNYFTKLIQIRKSLPLLALFIFFTYAFVTLLWSENIHIAFDTFFRFFKYAFIIIPVFFTTVTQEEIKSLLLVFTTSLILYALFSIGIFLEIYTINNSSKANPKGIMAYAVVTPYMAIATLFSSIFFFFIKNTKVKIILSLFTILSFTALFLNNGRAGQLAFFLTLIVLSVIYRKKIFSNVKYILFAFSLVVLSLGLLTSFNKLDRFVNAFSELQNSQEKNFAGSWGQREYLWYAAAEIIQQHPLLGAGAGDNIPLLKTYEKLHPSDADYLGTFHSQHLDILTRFGIIGYILFLLPVILLLIQLKNDYLVFLLAITFFSITFFDAIGDIILLMKPYNNIFILLFTLFATAAHNLRKQKVR